MAKTIEHKCPNCGGTLTFDPSLQKVVCHYCQTEFDVKALLEADEVLEEQFAGDFDTSKTSSFSEDDSGQLKVYRCSSCGSEIICDENVVSTICPYCDSAVILSGRVSGSLKPDYVIPFKSEKNDIIEALNKYLKKRWLLPKVFKTQKQIESVKSMYVPYWIYDADIYARLRFKATTVSTYTSGSYQYTTTKHYKIIREGFIGFDKIPVDASSKMPDDLMECLEPFNFTEAMDFQTAYISGFLSEKYDHDSEHCSKRAQKRIEVSTIQAFQSTISGMQNIILTSSNLNLQSQTAHYALLPIWIMNVKWKDKQYAYGVNGQSKKVAGNLPISGAKLFGFAALFFGIFFGLFLGLFAIFMEKVEIVGLLAGCIAGLTAMLIFIFVSIKRYKNVSLQKNARNYIRGNQCRVDRADTIYLYSTTSRIRVGK